MTATKTWRLYLFLLAAILWIGLACNLPAPGSVSVGGAQAPATLTAQAVQALIATHLAPTQTTLFGAPSATPASVEATPTPLASPTATLTHTPAGTEMCSDKATFVADVSAPDGSQFSTGEAFVKTWRLRNAGTCTWTPQYALVFAGGDQMSGASPIPLTTYVKPGEEIDLSVPLTAPKSSGDYQGQWKLLSADHRQFGIGDQADKPFWVRVKVAPSAADSNLGTPDWKDTFKDSSKWYLLKTAYTEWRVKNDQLIMSAIPGGGDEWGLATAAGLSDFHLEATFKTGEACSGLDRYGVLVRAPTANSGYVFGFSCDGRYRLYKWDGNNYTALQEWKQSSAIHSGPSQTNRLGMRAEGDVLKLYANGSLLAEIIDATYDSGRFGLFIGSVNTDELQIFVDDIAYWDLNK